MSGGKPPPLPGGELELALLEALWLREGWASARELHGEVGTSRGIVYTTVAKVLDRLLAKGMVERRRAGRAYAYRARVRRAETKRALARGLVEKLLGDDPQPAAAALLGALEDVSPELLDELARELESRKRGRHGA